MPKNIYNTLRLKYLGIIKDHHLSDARQSIYVLTSLLQFRFEKLCEKSLRL